MSGTSIQGKKGNCLVFRPDFANVLSCTETHWTYDRRTPSTIHPALGGSAIQIPKLENSVNSDLVGGMSLTLSTDSLGSFFLKDLPKHCWGAATLNPRERLEDSRKPRPYELILEFLRSEKQPNVLRPLLSKIAAPLVRAEILSLKSLTILRNHRVRCMRAVFCPDGMPQHVLALGTPSDPRIGSGAVIQAAKEMGKNVLIPEILRRDADS